LIKNGAERVIEECRDHMRTLRRLQEYNYFEGTADKGSGVREKSKQLIDLLGSNETIRTEREKAKRLKNKFTGVGSDGGSYGNSGSYGGSGGSYGGSGGGSDSRYDSGRNDSYSGGGSGGRRDSYSGGGNNGGSGLPILIFIFCSDISLDRYRDNDSRDSRRASDSGSYGGSYDSGGARGRYSDEPRDTHQNDQNEDQFKTTSIKKTVAPSGGGKFKVNIKSEPAVPRANPSASSQPAQAQVDFFGGGETFSSPASTFDAFGKVTLIFSFTHLQLRNQSTFP
jgi:hypothetical protein